MAQLNRAPVSGSMVLERDDVLEKALSLIDEFRHYESSFDPNDPRVSEFTIETAKRLVERVYERCKAQSITWKRPQLSVDPAARIHVGWGERGMRTLWMLEGGLEQPVVLVIRRIGSE